MLAVAVKLLMSNVAIQSFQPNTFQYPPILPSYRIQIDTIHHIFVKPTLHALYIKYIQYNLVGNIKLI